MKVNKIKRMAVLLPILLLCAGCNSSSDSGSVSDSAVISSSASSSSSTSKKPSSSASTSSTSSTSSVSSSSKPEESSSTESSEEQSTSEESIPEEITSGYVESEPSVTSFTESSSATVPESSYTPGYSEPESSSSEAPPPVVPSVPDDPIQSLISQMSLKERIYQMFFVNPEQITGGGTVLTPIDLTDKPVGGILYMGGNLESVEQTREMIAGTQTNALLNNGIGVFIAVDEEGGRVARCAWKLGTTEFEGMAVYGERNNADEAFNIGKTIGADIGALGFNVDFAPVADVDISPYNELGDRIFSSDPYVVANMVSNVVRGLNYSGVAATLKHFPGLGAENGNTHTDSAIVIDRTLEQLRNEEFVPFGSGIQAGADFVMVGHQQVTAFGDELPADLSYTAVTEMLRGELGFEGIAVTDSQVMNTISNLYYSRTAAVMSVKAGVDMILTPEDLDDAVNGVYNAVLSGEISEERINESVTRILTVKQKMGLLA